MSLKKKIKELEAEIKKEDGVEAEAEKTEEEAVEEAPVEKPEAESEKPETEEKPAAEAEKKEETAVPEATPAERARLRVLERENRELKARREHVAPPKEEAKKDQDPEPSKEEDPVAWLQWDNRRLNRQLENESKHREDREKREQAAIEYDEAKAEFTQFERSFAARTPDYEKVSRHAVQGIAAEIMEANPDLPPHKLGAAVERELLRKASLFLNAGLDPIQGLYDSARTKYGYKDEAPEPKPEEKPAAKLDLEKLNKAKQKSVAPAGGGRNAKPGISTDEFSKMTLAQKAKLSKSEIDELIANAD